MLWAYLSTISPTLSIENFKTTTPPMVKPSTTTSTKIALSNDLGYLNIGKKGYHLA
jgi:hypothetical protein